MSISLSDISFYFLILTAFFATVFYRKYKNTPLRYIVYYLWYAVVLESVGTILWIKFHLYNVWWYNFGINIELLFYLYLYSKYITNANVLKLIRYGAVIYEGYFFINYFLISESWNTYQVYPFVVGGLLLVIVVFLFLLEMFQSDKVLFTSKYLIFWISLGLLFYNIIPMPLLFGQTFIELKAYSRDVRVFLQGIQYVGNLLMYFSFIFGFIWSSMTYKSL